MRDRERWKSRMGLILAAAGNAVGLGNFLRFPVQAAQNGGGAFMIPYFISFLLLGIPMMWMEWAIGRYGGSFGHGTTPGMFHRLWPHKISKYLGTLGVLLPFGVGLYYVYITSWTLGFSFYSLTGKYFGSTTPEAMDAFLKGYQGVETNQYFTSVFWAYFFFLLTLALCFYILHKGIASGIETLGKIGMPLLFLLGVVLVVRVLSLGTPDARFPDRSVLKGLAFIWQPRFEELTNASIWLAGAGQIFFTLSVGWGIMETYASYLRRDDDVVLNGLTTCSINEVAEVVIGGSIAIPVAVAFFGLQETTSIAKAGSFNLGFQSMPLIFQKMILGQIFGAAWFFLLFLAGLTSAVALFQAPLAFLQDEFNIPRRRAIIIVALVVFLFVQPVIFFLKHGFLDELDFWLGTFGLFTFGTIEVIIFCWLFGAEKGWKEMHKGAHLTIPRPFFYILKYITPLILMAIFFSWLYQEGIDKFWMKGAAPEDVPYQWGARFLILFALVFLVWGVKRAWQAREMAEEMEEFKP